MKKYVDMCRTYEILLQDSGLLPKPRDNWNVFVPEQGMIAHVYEDNSDYEFNGTEWVKVAARMEERYSSQERRLK